jgi:division protein CdvB (Snf7/Vps24/ESCRT-III family)
MKSKKAVTLLTRIETLLSDVLDEYSVIEKHVEKNVRAVLLSAQASVVSAMNFISALPSAEIPAEARQAAIVRARRNLR